MVAPLFLLFIFALVEFGRYVMVEQALTNAAREGSRTAALATTKDTLRVRAAVDDGLRGVLCQFVGRQSGYRHHCSREPLRHFAGDGD